jgi:hypothetical protein
MGHTDCGTFLRRVPLPDTGEHRKDPMLVSFKDLA